jgi:hypothetical protein
MGDIIINRDSTIILKFQHFNMKIDKILNFLFVFTVIVEAIFLVVFPLYFHHSVKYYYSFKLAEFSSPLWYTLPFILLTGLSAAYYKTIVYSIIFLIVNLSLIMIMASNSLDEEYVKLKTRTKIDKISITGVIILGIFQVIYLILCIILFKIRSWKWISDPINPINQLNELDDKLKKILEKIHKIHQYEKASFLMTFSFLGIWIFLTEITNIFDIKYFNPHSPIKDQFDNSNLFYLFNMIIIIPILTVSIVIEKESVCCLLLFFYGASCFEIVIISLRLFRYVQNFNPDHPYSEQMYMEKLIIGK